MFKNSKKNNTKIKAFLIFGIALILIIAVSIVVVLEYVIIQTRLLEKEQVQNSGLFWIIMFGSCSIIIGLILASVLQRIILKPINKLIDGMSALANGEFDTRINLGEVMEMQTVSDSFNRLATELENTEILRSDFVNNFSHELKTPIVSLSGLISLMKNENLPLDKKKKYLEIIEEEINRLAEMTTKMLELSRIEKQEIIKDKTRFNLSEQIRNCVLLLEKKWSVKNLSLSLDFDEVYLTANEDMIKQVFINLLDNAFKFAYQDSIVEIKIVSKKDLVIALIKNTGKPISEKDKNKIFNKFYRGENASVGEGNGIGLSLVKNIVDKHNGTIELITQNEETTFKVTFNI